MRPRRSFDDRAAYLRVVEMMNASAMRRGNSLIRIVIQVKVAGLRAVDFLRDEAVKLFVEEEL